MLQRNNYINLQRTERINTAVDFPINGLNPNGEDDADNEPTKYDLIGGVFHKERNCTSAHFTAILKCGDIWIEYDDNKFKPNAFINS